MRRTLSRSTSAAAVLAVAMMTIPLGQPAVRLAYDLGKILR
jgi:hypothetical protein